MYEIDGVPLSDPQGRWRLHRETQRRTPVTMRAVEATVPGLDGALPIYGEAVEPTALGLELSVYGTEEQIEERCAFLRGLLGKTHAPLLVSRRDGLTAEAKPAAITDPVMTARYARMSVVLSIPAGVWRGPTRTADVPLGSDARVTALDGSTRSVNDALFLIDGPATGLTLTDVHSGAVLSYTRAIPDDQTLLIVCDEWRANQAYTTSWGSSLGNSSRYLDATGPRSATHLLPLTPQALPDGTTETRLHIAATGTTDRTRVRIRARTAHL